MTYWPVAILIVCFAIWLVAQMLKNAPDTFVKCLFGSYGVGGLVGFLTMGNESGVAVIVIGAVLGTVLLVVSLLFCMFWQNA